MRAGMSLERALGSVSVAWLMLLLVVLGDAAYVFFSFVAAFGPARRADILAVIEHADGLCWRHV